MSNTQLVIDKESSLDIYARCRGQTLLWSNLELCSRYLALTPLLSFLNARGNVGDKPMLSSLLAPDQNFVTLNVYSRRNM